MKEDILKFRKVCDILKQDKGYKLPQLIKELGVSEPTFYKLINTDINELKIQSSVLGLVQDFNKKHLDDVRYAGIEGIKEPAPIKEKKVLKDQHKVPSETVQQSDDMPTKEATKKSKDKIIESACEDFISVLAEAAKRLPDNVRISISINGYGS